MLSVIVSPARTLLAESWSRIPRRPPTAMTDPYPSARVVTKADIVPRHQIISEYQFNDEYTHIERDEEFFMQVCNKALIDMKMYPFRDLLEAADTSIVMLNLAHEHIPSVSIEIPVGTSRMFFVDRRVKMIATVLKSAALSLTFHQK